MRDYPATGPVPLTAVPLTAVTLDVRPARPTQPPATAPTCECVCGQVCVCLVDHDLLRPLASYLATRHHGEPCICGLTVCGYARYTALILAEGAFYRA